MQTPAAAAKRLVSQRIYFTDPRNRMKHAAPLLDREISPEERARRQAWGFKMWRECLSTPEVRARALSPEAIARRSAIREEATMGWCPPDRRDEYRALNGKFPAAEARAIIEADIAAVARRTVASNLDAMREREERRIANSY